jgi:hypothetical protein
MPQQFLTLSHSMQKMSISSEFSAEFSA